jgi:hypothetical protein
MEVGGGPAVDLLAQAEGKTIGAISRGRLSNAGYPTSPLPIAQPGLPSSTAPIGLGAARRAGVNMSAGILTPRPEVTVRTASGFDERRIHADRFQIKVGIVYAIF